MAEMYDSMQQLVQIMEGLDVNIFQQIVGKAADKHGFEFRHKSERIPYYGQKEIVPDTPYLNQQDVLQASQVMVQQLVEKGVLKGNIPKLDNFNGDPQTTKIPFHVWEKQVLALEGDYISASIRTAIRNSLKGRALQDISILSPDTDWKVLLDTLRVKYQHKASFDSMLSVFYGLQMTSTEDCAAFSSKLEQKLSYVQAMYPSELNNTQYWYLLRERFFHGLPVAIRSNIRNAYENGTDYYPLLQAARMIESELKTDPQYKSTDKVDLKSDKKAKAKGAASLIDTDKDLSNLKKVFNKTANDMKAIKQTVQDITTCIGHLQQNRSPQLIPPTNNVNPTNQGNNNTQGRGRGFHRGRGGRDRGRGQNFYQDRPPTCWWCKGNVSQEKAQHKIQDCPSFKQCREDWWETHPTNSNTTTPSNPKQEEKLGRESIEEVQQGSPGKDDPPQESSIHVSHAQPKKGFRRKKGENPIEIQADIKMKKFKRQSNYTNPDAWARLIGRTNTAPIYLEGHQVTGLLDTGSQLSMISRLFCEQHDLKIQPLSKLVDCDAVNGTQIEYEGYVGLNFQVPGRNFSEDHLFLVVPPIEYHKEVPAIVGIYVIDRYVQYLKNIGADIVPTLDHSWQSTYYARIEAMRLREAHENEAPLGFAKVTKATIIPAGQRKEIHALTKIRHGGYGVNLIGEVSEMHPLPQGLQLKNSYCDLTPGSAKVNLMIENTTNKNVVIPARAVVCQLNLANKIPKILMPNCNDDNLDDKADDFSVNHADLDDSDSGLTFEKVRAHQVIVEDLGEDFEEDCRDKSSHDKSSPEFVSDFTPQHEQRNTIESEDCKDSGEWLLDELDLTGLEEWPEELQVKAKDMLKRNASIFSKHDLDMGRTNLVKHNIVLTDPIPFKERYRTIPPQLFSEVKAHLQEMLDLGAIRHSNSPWASAIVLVRKPDGKLRFCIDLRKLNNRTMKDSYSLPRIEHVLDQLLGSTIFTTLD